MSNHLDYEINKELGECYLFMGELDKAEEYYRKAAGSNGVHPDPYLGLATIAVQRGLFDDALVLYKKAADIEPGDKALAGMGLIEMERGENEPRFQPFRAGAGYESGQYDRCARSGAAWLCAGPYRRCHSQTACFS